MGLPDLSSNGNKPEKAADWEDVFGDVEIGGYSPDHLRYLSDARQGVPPHYTKFTPQRVARIFTMLSEGYPQSSAAEAAGITRQTYYNWLDRGEEADQKRSEGITLDEEEERYLAFYYGCQQARHEFEREALQSIKEQGKNGNWQALMTILERTMPEKYGRRQTIKHEGEETKGKIEVKLDIGDRPDPREIEDAEYSMKDEDDGES